MLTTDVKKEQDDDPNGQTSPESAANNVDSVEFLTPMVTRTDPDDSNNNNVQLSIREPTVSVAGTAGKDGPTTHEVSRPVIPTSDLSATVSGVETSRYDSSSMVFLLTNTPQCSEHLSTGAACEEHKPVPDHSDNSNRYALHLCLSGG
jgi:hypothetical protein